MIDPGRARYYRVVLTLAALYNAAFGLWAGLVPGAFFRAFRLDPPRYPGIWQCLGMVVGLYGALYALAAHWLGREGDRERARPLVAIGLAGKVLGPLGWLWTVARGEWPLRTVTLVLLDDVVWWLPFVLLLLEGTRAGTRLRAAAPWACAALNAAAVLSLIAVLRPGTEAADALPARRAYVAAHPVIWRGGWGVWLAAAAALLGFYGWWGARLDRAAPRPSPWPRAAFALAALGIGCDFTADSLFLSWGTWPATADAAALARLAALCGGGLANGLYCAAGALLTWRTPLPPWLRAWAWAAWASGFALSAATAAGSVPAVMAASAALFGLFCPLVVVLGWRLR
ncbi:MAG TPA: hypothetical protein VG389_14110 [Myxococcota bacterium]|jgi:hypothetical protein|nr:hypothetical protein [Myxococcota bacterium]